MQPIRFLSCLFALMPCAGTALAASAQAPDAIYAAARSLIDQTLGNAVEHETNFSPLDPRLHLNNCPQPLQAFTLGQAIKPGRNSIGVKCNAVNGWSLYVSAYIKAYQNVAVLTQPVKRGELLSNAPIRFAKMDISQVHAPPVSDKNNLVNKQASHNLSQGAILSQRDMAAATLIKRGETVAITALNPHFCIQMQGIALMDGVLGQNIRIKNNASGRTVAAIVTKAGMVSVNL